MANEKYTSVEGLYDKFNRSVGVSTDTRTLRSGELFFALRGPNFDGNTMAAKAIEAGALYAVIDNPNFAIENKTLLVQDSLKALQQLASYHRSKQNIPVIGITGSNGKTTTKELISAVLSSDFKVHCTKGNYNNHIGVPLTILNADSAADLWLIEMGTNQPGDIAFLCDIAKPNYGLITNIGIAHLEKLIDLEGVFREKSALYDAVLQSEGILFINQSDPYLCQYNMPELTVAGRVDYKLTTCPYGDIEEEVSTTGLLSVNIIEKVNKEKYPCFTQLFGSYNINNIAAALTIAAHFGLKLEDAIGAISRYTPTNMRSQQLQTERNTIIIDGYNANPSSMRASLGAFLETASHHSIAIVGDMLELGDDAPRYHSEIVDMLKTSGMEYYLVGPIFKGVSQGDVRAFINVIQLLDHIKQEPIVSKEVFIKASRGIRLEKLLDWL